MAFPITKEEMENVISKKFAIRMAHSKTSCKNASYALTDNSERDLILQKFDPQKWDEHLNNTCWMFNKFGIKDQFLLFISPVNASPGAERYNVDGLGLDGKVGIGDGLTFPKAVVNSTVAKVLDVLDLNQSPVIATRMQWIFDCINKY